jgi:hypothetical protein
MKKPGRATAARQRRLVRRSLGGRAEKPAENAPSLSEIWDSIWRAGLHIRGAAGDPPPLAEAWGHKPRAAPEVGKVVLGEVS